MSIKSSGLIPRLYLTLLLLLCTLPAFSILRKEFDELEKLYNRGKLNEIADELNTLKPNNDDERACINYYTAKLMIKSSDAFLAHEAILTKFPKTKYAQYSLLELGKMHILERDVNKAAGYLRRINSTELMERFYWLGLCEYWEDQYSSAISNAENYLRQDSKGDYAEAAYYLMAECYIDQKKFYSAGVVLTKLQSLGIKDIDEQYLMYRLGYVNEQSDKDADAIGFYRKGYEMDKYSQIAFLIEDRIFELKSRNRSLDIGFLYPYTLLQLPTLQADSTSQSTIAITPAPQHSNTPVLQNPGTPAPQLSTTPPLKLSAKPASGFWLQAGRFSQEGNANKLVVNIRLLNIPAAYYADKSARKTNWVVVCGAFPDKPSAEEAKLSLGKHDINSFITQY